MERLQKVMAHAGIAARRKCEEIIEQGRVKVNGKVVTTLGTKVREEDLIKVDGKVITQEKKVYIILNKPTGYITTVDDPEGRKTVLSLVKDVKQRIYPVGRLDFNTSGLLILTNDGELTFKLTHPSHMIDKTYRVQVKGEVKDEDINRLEKGLFLKDGLTAPARVENLKRSNNCTRFDLTIYEGRNRQVRRMCSHIGYTVLKLKRIKFSFLTLSGIAAGDYRYLSNKEVKKLHELK
ncbi:MAG: pseudouridine synthase [bacterium]